jgi:hypothetical protein
MSAAAKWTIHVEKSGTVYIPFTMADATKPTDTSVYVVDKPVQSDLSATATTRMEASSFRIALYAGLRSVLNRIAEGL